MRDRRKFGQNWDDEADIDPMGGLANLADVMLVFACGLMVALVLRWNVDLRPPKPVDSEQLQEVTGSEALNEDAFLGERYQSEGTVYRDMETGKLYIVP